MASVEVRFEDVDNRYEGSLADRYDRKYIETQIADAVDYADSRWGAKIESRLSGGVLTSNLYRRTISDAVLRVARNPEGFASENESGYGYSKRLAVASGNLWFTGDDLETLTGTVEAQPMTPGTAGIGLDRGWR